MRESDLEAYLVDRAKGAGGVAYKFISPTAVGVPDRLVLLPNGKMFFAEIKSLTGRTSTAQIRRAQEIGALGYKVYFVCTKHEVDRLFL